MASRIPALTCSVIAHLTHMNQSTQSTSMYTASPANILAAAPVYDDWPSVSKLHVHDPQPDQSGWHMRNALVVLSPLAGAPHFRDPVGVPAGRYTLYAKQYVRRMPTAVGVQRRCAQLSSGLASGARRWLDGVLDVDQSRLTGTPAVRDARRSGHVVNRGMRLQRLHTRYDASKATMPIKELDIDSIWVP
ncbi:hypothetical protein P171DRAFT_450131 [Karstenula rhodostoma CBS 690.94]|uniref:Uncharacterized protein n=1 Tax=Karstenula rhodostoma CBS 690.94 TaxID=1392251 RepID=A0A9P4P2R0_9PLEO|nr:hypothetical protein P171DRAFT_450131 [Karstenula rhodostoma CBS 690.94]